MTQTTSTNAMTNRKLNYMVRITNEDTGAESFEYDNKAWFAVSKAHAAQKPGTFVEIFKWDVDANKYTNHQESMNNLNGPRFAKRESSVDLETKKVLDDLASFAADAKTAVGKGKLTKEQRDNLLEQIDLATEKLNGIRFNGDAQ